MRGGGASTSRRTALPRLLARRFGRALAPGFHLAARNALLFPRLAEAAPVMLEQSAGEVVFVPSGWHHEVENLDDALSVNCNWCV